MSNISQNLNLRQSQDLVMTPQLQQAIKMLQLNNAELTEFVEEVIEQNPLLEKQDKDADREAVTDNNQSSELQASEADSSAEKSAPAESADINDSFDAAWTGNEAASGSHDYTSDSMAGVGKGGSLSFESAEQSFENRMSEEPTLREHLMKQLYLAFDDTRDQMIGTLLIDLLDEGGYFRHEAKDIAERLACSEDRVERLLERMKQFDPTGVFAADLSECMALQLEEKGTLDDPMKILLENLEHLASYDYKKLADMCKVNETYLQDMVEEIRRLNPKPAGDFDHFVTQTVVPDVIMRQLPKNLGGGWRVELNTDTLPRVLVNNTYYKDVVKRASAKSDKEYLNNQLQEANWLVKALDQRAQTITKVAAEIVEHQEMFFLYGIEYLKPLTLKEIAEKIDMHESTVSRVTTNKFMGTPRGIFELKYFFTTALASSQGGSHSSEAVKARIKTLIDDEDPKKILSDDRIVELLKEEGIDIARRTVAKYRDLLHIPSSVQRRKQKKNLSK